MAHGKFKMIVSCVRALLPLLDVFVCSRAANKHSTEQTRITLLFVAIAPTDASSLALLFVAIALTDASSLALLFLWASPSQMLLH
jgi:hypothetical protein